MRLALIFASLMFVAFVVATAMRETPRPMVAEDVVCEGNGGITRIKPGYYSDAQAMWDKCGFYVGPIVFGRP
jgi:hypothetical protein